MPSTDCKLGHTLVQVYFIEGAVSQAVSSCKLGVVKRHDIRMLCFLQSSLTTSNWYCFAAQNWFHLACSVATATHVTLGFKLHVPSAIMQR